MDKETWKLFENKIFHVLQVEIKPRDGRAMNPPILNFFSYIYISRFDLYVN
jgi:hypothetical protein